MRVFKYLFAIWTAIAVYTLFSFFSGPKGISAYNQLLYEREQQYNNIRELGIINEELERTKNNLLYDQDTLMVYARQLGFAQEDERFIRIVGLTNARSAPQATGSPYIVKDPDYLSDRIIKITAICVGLFIFAFLFMIEIVTKSAE